MHTEEKQNSELQQNNVYSIVKDHNRNRVIDRGSSIVVGQYRICVVLMERWLFVDKHRTFLSVCESTHTTAHTAQVKEKEKHILTSMFVQDTF